ncbi:unnamed protein product [Linum trigynum]|uniref:Uncharacterized protein n=1 Tax=Linum trigynum TaxID=586398 RepID=A0AAV2F6P6_9ROSI
MDAQQLPPLPLDASPEPSRKGSTPTPGSGSSETGLESVLKKQKVEEATSHTITKIYEVNCRKLQEMSIYGGGKARFGIYKKKKKKKKKGLIRQRWAAMMIDL